MYEDSTSYDKWNEAGSRSLIEYSCHSLLSSIARMLVFSSAIS